MKKLILAIIILTALATQAQATEYIVYGTTIYTYTQSTDESTAHLIKSSKGIYQGGAHPWCGNRMYIDFADEALLKRAMMAEAMNQTINIMYEDAAEQKFANGHIQFGCKLLSIWR